LNTLF